MPDSTPKPPMKIAGGRWELEKKLGAGCFGEVWRGRLTEAQPNAAAQVAIKFESSQSHAAQLEHEAEVLKSLSKAGQDVQGFVQCYHFGHEGRHLCLVMDLLGKSLEDRLQLCGSRFNVPSTVLVAEQVLRRIEYLHSKCIIHRDIKPENFMFGVKEKVHHLYLIDFGLSKPYWDGKHSNPRTKLNLTGTARYASINAHKGLEQSRRDDMEAIGHMLIYFLRGQLPWSGLEAKTQEEKYRKIREKKEDIPLEELCAGYPPEFQTYLRRMRDLEFKEKPNYAEMRQLFRDVRTREGPKEDHQFQWNADKSSEGLVPLNPYLNVKQPDELGPSKGCACRCTCFGSSRVMD
mmetsp:Transcript_75846/g.226121  ORF Transcript_75846/g.226121 Transcript_75846/m.226121 type:complete len:348 (+) Transcript_75846:63-1106(+)